METFDNVFGALRPVVPAGAGSPNGNGGRRCPARISGSATDIRASEVITGAGLVRLGGALQILKGAPDAVGGRDAKEGGRLARTRKSEVGILGGDLDQQRYVP